MKIAAATMKLSPVIFFLLIGAGLTIPAADAFPGSGVFSISEKKEKEIGAEMHAEILENMPIYYNILLQEYVDHIGQELAKASSRPDLEYHFTIIDSEEINAFATPGGYVYINRGLMAYMTTEAQLAAVLAHEIGHIAARHASRQNTAGTAAKALSTVLAAFVAYRTGNSAAANTTQDVGDLAGTALVRGYGRDMELEADELGASYMARIGYDPQAVAEVIGVLKDHENFSRLKAKETGEPYKGYHGLFSTHPRNDTRLQNIIGNAAAVSKGTELRTDNTEFRNRLDFLKYSDERLNSALVDNRYYHRGLDITVAFPTGWAVQKGASAVQAVGPSDNAMIRMQVKRTNEELSPGQYIEQKLGISNLRDGEELELGDLSGYTGLNRDKPGQRIAVIYHRGRAIIFLTSADNQDLAHFYDTLFLSTISGIRPLTQEDKTLALGRKIRYMQANGGLTFELLGKYSPLEDYQEEQLRLLNGYYPYGEPDPGQWIKVVD